MNPNPYLSLLRDFLNGPIPGKLKDDFNISLKMSGTWHSSGFTVASVVPHDDIDAMVEVEVDPRRSHLRKLGKTHVWIT
jgi:hypothetical protein